MTSAQRCTVPRCYGRAYVLLVLEDCSTFYLAVSESCSVRSGSRDTDSALDWDHPDRDGNFGLFWVVATVLRIHFLQVTRRRMVQSQ